MKVSIITVVYNNENNILKCINSVKNQTYKYIEHIIIDGDSNDKTVSLINKNLNSKILFQTEKDTGMYNALNKGIKKSSGDIIGILHSDDIFYSNTIIEDIVRNFKKSDDIIYGNGMYFLNFNENARRIYKSNIFSKFYLYFGWIPLHTTIFCRRNIFDNYGLYSEKYKISSDYEISLRWFFNKNINKKFYNKWIVKMQLGGLSTNLDNQKIKSTEDYEIIKKFKLLGIITLFFKILRKVPQYLIPKIIKYK